MATTVNPTDLPPEDGMGILDHLKEFQGRVIRAVIAVAITTSLSFFFVSDLLKALSAPYGGKLLVLEPTEGISIFIRVGLTMGIAIASPIIIYQILAFVIPGLTPKELRLMRFVVPMSFILFLIGASFAWFLMIPTAIEYLATFGPEIFQVEFSSRGYVPFVMQLTMWIGVAFEMPLVMMFLAQLGFVTPKMLIQGWRLAVVGCVIAASVITPTVDPFNMALVALPLMGLYIISILFAYFPYRARRKRDLEEYPELVAEEDAAALAEQQAKD